ncbi:MAG: hypothetical protein ACLURG_02040 [Gemmiger sp.]
MPWPSRGMSALPPSATMPTMATRPPPRHAEELAQQMPVLKELLTDLGFVQVSKAGWEADDILGTLAAACEPPAAPRCWRPATGTACSWWTMPRPFCWRPTRRPSPWTPPPSGRNTALSRPSSLM